MVAVCCKRHGTRILVDRMCNTHGFLEAQITESEWSEKALGLCIILFTSEGKHTHCKEASNSDYAENFDETLNCREI